MFNLQVYKEELKRQVKAKKLAPKTCDYYLANLTRLEELCGGQDGSSAGILESAIIELCRNTKQVSKYIAAVKKYERDVLGAPKLLLYGEPLMRLHAVKPVITQGKKLTNSEVTYMHKINALPNKKLKLAFRLQKQSGLRIDEISSLCKQDITYCENGRIKLHVKCGKGRIARDVEVLEDRYLIESLEQLTTELDEDDQVFYSASYLKKKAAEYGMQTHDLRRINSRQRFRQERDQGVSRYKARAAVAVELGHQDAKVTSLYLGEEWKVDTEEEQ